MMIRKLLFCLTVVLIVSCGIYIVTLDPVGIPTWSDDGTEIACILRHTDMTKYLPHGSEHNTMKEVVIFDSTGKKIRSFGKEDYGGHFEDIFYMKTQGYIIVNLTYRYSKMYNIETGDRFRFDSPIAYVIPSYSGKILAVLEYYREQRESGLFDSYYLVYFVDPVNLERVNEHERRLSPITNFFKWSGDSLFLASMPRGRADLINLTDGSTQDNVDYPELLPIKTSSSYYCERRDVSLEWKDKQIIFHEGFRELEFYY